MQDQGQDVLVKKARQDLVTTAFFGFLPERVYTEIYAIGHNEYLKAMSALRASLLEEFPEKHELIELGCSKMLDRYSQEFGKTWFVRFTGYCRSNLFTIKDHIPVFKPEMEAVEENRLAHDKSLNLRHCIMATEYLNVQLLGKIRELDVEVEKRKGLLAKMAKTKQKLEVVKRAKELEQELDTVDLPDQPLEA